MAKVSPWHSIEPSDPQVYHDDTSCKTGNAIQTINRRGGTGNKPRCQQCADIVSKPPEKTSPY